MTDADVGASGLPKWVLWLGGALFVLFLLGLCGLFVNNFGLLAGTEPTAIPTSPAVKARLEIVEPKQGASVDIASPVQVSGVGGGLFEGNVVVQAFDGESNLLAEAATTIDGPDAGTGGSGPWSVTMNLAAPADPHGLIFAFSSSPVDGSIAASASVEVAYVDSSTGQAAIVIVDPDEGETVDIAKPVSVAGAGVGLFENNVVVQALDASGTVLAEEVTTTSAGQPGGVGQWTVKLGIQVPPASEGRIIAFSPSPTSDTPDASAGVSVIYAAMAPTATSAPAATATLAPTRVPSTITIAEPQNGAVLEISTPFRVAGTGSNLFENNVVVRALDIDGNTLAEQATILNTSELGGSGTWSVDLTVQVALGTPGHVVAFSPSPVEGEQPTAASISVTYGQVPETPARISITFPTHPSVVNANQPIRVTGSGAGLFENNVVVRALDWEGNTIAEQATTLDATEPGGEGNWSVQLTVKVKVPTPGLIVAFSPSATGSIPDAYDGVGVIYNVPVAVPPIAPTPLPTAEQPIVPSPEVTAAPTAEPTSTGSG